MQSKTATLIVHPWYLQRYASILCSNSGQQTPFTAVDNRTHACPASRRGLCGWSAYDMLDLQSSWLSCSAATPAICSNMLASVRSWMKP